MLSHKKPDSVINVKVEFGEGEGTFDGRESGGNKGCIEAFWDNLTE